MKNTIENLKKKSRKYFKCNEQPITKADTQNIPFFKR